MDVSRRGFLISATALGAGMLAGCGRPQAPSGDSADQGEQDQTPSRDKDAYSALALDMAAWRHDDDHDVYYQLGVPYSLTPASETYGKLSIFVPGGYFKAEGDGPTYRCSLQDSLKVASHDGAHAPVVMPIDCPDFQGQQPASSYSYEGLEPYMDSGCVYVAAGCRGRSGGYESRGSDDGYVGGAPWGLVDLKAAVRFLRYNACVLPGHGQTIVAMGLGSGGNLAALLGSTGDEAAFEGPLDEVGAALWDGEGEDISDAVEGVALWNPQVSLGSMDGAYEWLYGQYSQEGTRARDTWTGQLSPLLADAWADHLGELGLTGGGEGILTLDETTATVRTDGTYYEHLMDLACSAASAFFSSASFPVTVTQGATSQGGFPGLATTTDMDALAAGAAQNAAVASEQGATVDGPAPTTVTSTTFDSAEDYVAWLNEGGRWLTYNASRARVRISSLEPMIARLAPASLGCTCYDAVDDDSPWNQLFGTEDLSALHFSSLDAKVLEDHLEQLAQVQGFEATLPDQWSHDLAVNDPQGLSVSERCALYDPMDRLLPSGGSQGQGQVAGQWRINVGLAQSQVPFTEGIDLALALGDCGQETAVELNCVWQGDYGLSERTGDGISNVLAWVSERFPTPEAQEGEGDPTEGSQAQ